MFLVYLCLLFTFSSAVGKRTQTMLSFSLMRSWLDSLDQGIKHSIDQSRRRKWKSLSPPPLPAPPSSHSSLSSEQSRLTSVTSLFSLSQLTQYCAWCPFSCCSCIFPYARLALPCCQTRNHTHCISTSRHHANAGNVKNESSSICF